MRHADVIRSLQKIRWQAWNGTDVFWQRQATRHHFDAIEVLCTTAIDDLIADVRAEREQLVQVPRWLAWLNRRFA